MKFEIKDRDAAGRICKFSTNHGTITTPNLMPVINPNKILINPNIEVLCNVCPLDTHPDDLWCEWEFRLRKVTANK